MWDPVLLIFVGAFIGAPTQVFKTRYYQNSRFCRIDLNFQKLGHKVAKPTFEYHKKVFKLMPLEIIN